MGHLVGGFIAMREADLAKPSRQLYWDHHPDEARRRRTENAAFRALTADEMDGLEIGALPAVERMEQIAQETGLATSDLERLCHGFVYIMSEGLRPRAVPPKGTLP